MWRKQTSRDNRSSGSSNNCSGSNRGGSSTGRDCSTSFREGNRRYLGSWYTKLTTDLLYANIFNYR